jgi:hypothetical protein
MTDQHSPTGQAAQAVADLEAKIAATDAKMAANTNARAELAYAAHADDDKKARKSLNELSDESVRLQHEREDLTVALAEARRRHRSAIDDEAREGDRAAAIQVDALFSDLVKAYRAQDRALEVWASAVTAAAALHAKIRQLGCGHVAIRAPLDVERRALSTCIQGAQLWRGQFDHAPLEHGAKVRSLAAVAETWHAAVRQAPHGWIARRLGETVAAEAAE